MSGFFSCVSYIASNIDTLQSNNFQINEFMKQILYVGKKITENKKNIDDSDLEYGTTLIYDVIEYIKDYNKKHWIKRIFSSKSIKNQLNILQSNFSDFAGNFNIDLKQNDYKHSLLQLKCEYEVTVYNHTYYNIDARNHNIINNMHRYDDNGVINIRDNNDFCNNNMFIKLHENEVLVRDSNGIYNILTPCMYINIFNIHTINNDYDDDNNFTMTTKLYSENMYLLKINKSSKTGQQIHKLISRNTS